MFDFLAIVWAWLVSDLAVVWAFVADHPVALAIGGAVVVALVAVNVHTARTQR